MVERNTFQTGHLGETPRVKKEQAGGYLGNCKKFRTHGRNQKLCKGNWQKINLKSS